MVVSCESGSASVDEIAQLATLLVGQISERHEASDSEPCWAKASSSAAYPASICSTG